MGNQAVISGESLELEESTADGNSSYGSRRAIASSRGVAPLNVDGAVLAGHVD